MNFAKRLLFISGMAALTLSISAVSHAEEAEAGTVVVNGVNISQSAIDMLLKDRGVPANQLKNPELQKSTKEYLITRELLVQEARKKGMDKSVEIQTRLENTKQELLARIYFENFAKSHPVSENDIKNEYDRMKSEVGTKEYKVRHILVQKEDEAKSVMDQLKKGVKFEKLATEKSMDPGSKANGGDLGWSAPTRYVKPFADAVIAMKKGETTDKPVQSPFGWHVIRLDDVRALKFPTLAQAKPEIKQMLLQRAFGEHVNDLRKKSKIEMK